MAYTLLEVIIEQSWMEGSLCDHGVWFFVFPLL